MDNSSVDLLIKDIHKNFGTKKVLKGININVKDGEFVTLLGPSGCGKTTLLRIIAGMETADAGHVKFAGEEATRLHARERKVGFVFQHYALFRHMSVFENVAFGLRVKPRAERPDEASIRRRVMDLLKLVQLDWLADRYPSQLSGGQRQRIALARALAVEPKVLLLDEPFGALDAKVRKELRRWLRRLHDELHVTSIFVTHDQEEALEVADRVVVMNKGRIEQVGTPQEVWEHPASPFVYGFLGDVNLFRGRATGGQVQVGDWQIAAPEHAHALDAEAMAFVRPSDLTVAPYATGATSGLAARLDRALLIGPLARLELTPHDNPSHILEAHLPANEFRQLGVQEGDSVRVSPRKARVFLETVDDPAAMI